MRSERNKEKVIVNFRQNGSVCWHRQRNSFHLQNFRSSLAQNRS